MTTIIPYYSTTITTIAYQEYDAVEKTLLEHFTVWVFVNRVEGNVEIC